MLARLPEQVHNCTIHQQKHSGEKQMTLEELFRIAQKAGNDPERSACSDKREALAYMDPHSAEYRKQASKKTR